MRLSLHRAMLTYGGGLFLHTAASGRVAGLDTLYLRVVDDEGDEAVGEVRINIAYLNGLAAETVLGEALELVPRLDLSGDPEDLLSDPPAALSGASAPMRMVVDMALYDRAAKRAGLPLAEWLSGSQHGLRSPLIPPPPFPREQEEGGQGQSQSSLSARERLPNSPILAGKAPAARQAPSPRLRGEDGGSQMRGGADLGRFVPPLIRPFGAPSPRERGEGDATAAGGYHPKMRESDSPCGEGSGVGVRTGAAIAEGISHPTNQTLSISDDATFLSRAEAYVARGFRELKVRIGAGDFADDLRRLRLLRDRFGDEVKLAADANGAWSLEDAPRRIAGLAQFRLAYLEQPVAPCPFEDLARLSESSPIPIMLDESVSGDRAVADLCAGGHRLMAHLKLVKLGGLGSTMRAARRLSAAGVPYMIGQMNEGGLATAAALHACAALRPCFAELYGADGLENDPAPGLIYRAGAVAMTARPGLGLDFMAERTQTLWEEEK